MRNLTVMFVTAVCFLFLLKLKWPKNKNIYEVTKYVSLCKLARRSRARVKGAVSRNSAKLGNHKMPVKLRET